MMTLRPFTVESCFALPLTSLKLGIASLAPGAPPGGGTRRT